MIFVKYVMKLYIEGWFINALDVKKNFIKSVIGC